MMELPYNQLLPSQQEQVWRNLLAVLPTNADMLELVQVLQEVNPDFNVYFRVPQFTSVESIINILSYIL